MWILWSLLLIVNLTIVIGIGVIPARLKGAEFKPPGPKPIAEERYAWMFINYTWPSSQEYNEAVKNGDYDRKHNVLVGMKVWKDKFYFALPRIKPGVPVTMATTSYEPIKHEREPLLEPYPNWQMQKADDCKTSLQSVQGMEIDPWGRMWVLNTGRVNYKNSMKTCPHRLIVFDLENRDKILLDYEFPKDVVNPKTGLLSDLVLDHEEGGHAYITNSDDVKPSIVVFSLESMSSWAVTADQMKPTDANIKVKGDAYPFTKPIGVHAIAMSNLAVFFAPLSSRNIFYVYAGVLRLKLDDVSHATKTCRKTPGTHTAGIITDSREEMYIGSLEENTVAYRRSVSPKDGYLNTAYNDEWGYKESRLQWMSSFAIDVNGNMWVLSSRMTRIEAEKLGSFYEDNFWLIKLDQKDIKNYQYTYFGDVPDEMPVFK